MGPRGNSRPPPAIVRTLQDGEPSIAIRSEAEVLVIGVWMMQPGEERIVATRLRQVLARRRRSARAYAECRHGPSNICVQRDAGNAASPPCRAALAAGHPALKSLKIDVRAPETPLSPSRMPGLFPGRVVEVVHSGVDRQEPQYHRRPCVRWWTTA